MGIERRPLNIALIANYRPDGQESMQRFADMLESGLSAQGHAVQVLRPDPVLIEKAFFPRRLEKWTGYADKFLRFSAQLRRLIRGADVVHICDHSNAMYVSRLDGVPHLVTCHDLLAVKSALGEVPENPTRWSGRILQRWILTGLRRAACVACVSEQTRNDLQRLAALPPQRAPVVYNGLNHPYAPMDAGEARERVWARLGREAGPFFLHVGGNQWYKNRMGVLRIFKHLRARPAFKGHALILVGKPWTDEMRRYVHERGLTDSVLAVDGAESEELRAFYTLADAFLFPSLQEGFGWPIIEAQACGCPVFTSRRAPMTEVGGDAALYIDPADAEGAAAAIEAHLPRRQQIRAAGLANARRFAPERMIDGYLQVYEGLRHATPASH